MILANATLAPAHNSFSGGSIWTFHVVTFASLDQLFVWNQYIYCQTVFNSDKPAELNNMGLIIAAALDLIRY